jgi:hypothetical protein
MSKTYKAKRRRKDRRTKRDPNAVTRGIDREIRKENGTLVISRGLHTIHKSRRDKRRSRNSDRRKAISESEDQ